MHSFSPRHHPRFYPKIALKVQPNHSFPGLLLALTTLSSPCHATTQQQQQQTNKQTNTHAHTHIILAGGVRGESFAQPCGTKILIKASHRSIVTSILIRPQASKPNSTNLPADRQTPVRNYSLVTPLQSSPLNWPLLHTNSPIMIVLPAAILETGQSPPAAQHRRGACVFAPFEAKTQAPLRQARQT